MVFSDHWGHRDSYYLSGDNIPGGDISRAIFQFFFGRYLYNLIWFPFHAFDNF